MHTSKIHNVILHKSTTKSFCSNDTINEFLVNVIETQFRRMQITPKEKIQIIDEIIKTLSNP